MADELFTPFSALAGGALIGLSASFLLLFVGRVAGVSGIVAGLAGVFGRGHDDDTSGVGDVAWRVAFVVGLLLAGGIAAVAFPATMESTGPLVGRTPVLMAVAGVIVGIGARVGGGCTSGHGVCGLSRFSLRSLVATLTFMATGAAAATALRLLSGGGS
jgi:uncharacterized membrane protein YedE/YeeE